MRMRTIPLMFAAAFAAGCTAKQQAASTPPAAVEQAGSATPAVVTIHAHDFAFDAPNAIRAGVTTFHLINDGPGLHHVQLVRLDSGRTFADLQQALKNPGPPPRWVSFVANR